MFPNISHDVRWSFDARDGWVVDVITRERDSQRFVAAARIAQAGWTDGESRVSVENRAIRMSIEAATL